MASGWMNCASVEPNSPAPAGASTAGLTVALAGFGPLYFKGSEGSFEHKKLFNICLQWQLLQRLNLGPKHKMEGRSVLSIKSHGHVDAITDYHKIGAA